MSTIFSPEPVIANFPAPRGSRDNRRQSAFMALGVGLITDGIRQDIPLSGDGVSPGSFGGVWPAVTNLATNGGFETNTTGATAVSASVARVTAQAKFGAASCEVVTSNAVAAEGFYETFTATVAVHVVSAWVRGAGGGTVRMAVRRDSDGGLAQTGTAITLTSAWQRITLTTTNLTAVTWRAYVETNVQQNITYQVDGLQVELPLFSLSTSIATPYIETNGGTAARGTPVSTYPYVSPMFTAGQGWVATRVRMPYASTACPQGEFQLNWFRWFADANNDFSLSYRAGSTFVFNFSRRANGGTSRTASQAGTFTAGQLITVIGKWTTTTASVSKDGAAFTTTSFGAETPTMGAVLPTVASQQSGYEIFWQACGSGTLADADAAAIHALGNIGNVPAMFPGACKLYWQALNSKALTAT